MRRLMVLAALLAGTPACAQQADIGAVNGAFEGDEDGDGIADGWTSATGAPEGSIDVRFSLEPGRERGTCQRIDCTRYEDGHAMVCQVGSVAIERGEWYRLTVWLRAQGEPRVGIGIHDTDGWRQCGLWRTVHVPERWRRYSWRFQGDHDCHETSRLQVWFSSTGTLWVDDLVLERIEAPSQPNLIEDIGSKNLLPNSSFECGSDRWISAGCWRLFGEVVEEDAVHGSRCMKVAWARATAPVFSFDYYDMRREPYAAPAITSEGWMRVEEGAPYVLSAWLRADREVACHLRARGPSRQYAGRTITLGRDWQRFELPFTATEDLCYVQVDVDCDEAGLDQLVYWVDAVQLETGKTATEYEPRRPVEIAAGPIARTGIYVGDEPPEMWVGVYNDGPDPVELTALLRPTDGFDRDCEEIEVSMRVPAGGEDAVICTTPRLPFARITVSADDTDECSVRMASLPELDLADSPFGLNHAYGWDPYVELARKLGILWARDWSLKWDHVEPEPGRFDFDMADYQIDRPRGLGMQVLCMFPFPSASWSTTAPALEEVPEELRERAANRIRSAYAPRDPGELENYVYETVMHYRDRIDVWEVFNESIFTSYALPRKAGYTATDYIPLLEAVYRGCKHADPDCAVMGGYSTPPGNFDELHRPFIEAGGLEFCDLYSLHIYPGGEPEFIAEQLDRITDLMREHGGVRPMWMTEYAYYADDDPDPFPRRWPALVESELVQAQWNTRMCVTQLAHGVEKVFYHIWHTRANRDSGARIFFEYGGAPRKIAVSQATMARFLGAAPEFVRAVDIGENASCYLFRGADDALVAVAWHHWDDIDLSRLGGREVYDLFGSRATPDDEQLPGPVFVFSHDASADDFAGALQEALTP